MQSSKKVPKLFLPKPIASLLLELLIVGFGVYLGFMANTYTQSQNEKSYINATIKEMYQSLAEDIIDAEDNKEGHYRGLKAVSYFAKLIKNKPINQDSFLIYLQVLTRNFVSVQNSSAFETIRSRGFNVIEDDSLRRQMVKLYDFKYETLEKIEEKYQESQIYSNESNHINTILSNSLVFDENLKLQKIILPLNITNQDRNRLILILQRISTTRNFNIMVYEDAINHMKLVRKQIATQYPFVLKQ